MAQRETRDGSVEAAYQRYFPVIRAKCRRILKDSDEAQDVAQDTFERLLRSNLLSAHVAVVTAWIYRTSTHLAVDRLRSRARRDRQVPTEPWESATFEVAGTEADPDEQLQRKQVLDLIAARAPRDELEVAVLARVDRLTQQEAAQVVGVSERTIRRLLERFDRRIAELKKEHRP